jgi:hypothetical protein
MVIKRVLPQAGANSLKNGRKIGHLIANPTPSVGVRLGVYFLNREKDLYKRLTPQEKNFELVRSFS